MHISSWTDSGGVRIVRTIERQNNHGEIEMKAEFQSNRTDASTLIDLTAKDDKDMEKVEAVIKELKEQHGFEEIAADHEHHVTIGIQGWTIAEMKAAYKEAKKATR